MIDIDIPYKKRNTTIKHDSDVFPREYNKITTMGWLTRKQCLITCDGNGKLGIMLDPVQTIDGLHKLYKKGKITESEFESKKKELLDRIK